MNTYCAFDHKDWDAAGLKDVGSLDYMEFVNEREDGFDQSAGEWYCVDEKAMTIYYGTYGNYNSPGASSFTYADVYEQGEEEKFNAAVAKWESKPERLETDDEPEEDEEESTLSLSLEIEACSDSEMALKLRAIADLIEGGCVSGDGWSLTEEEGEGHDEA